jgi:hypothetical protein
VGRLTRKEATAARAGEESLPAIGAERHLRLRGVLIPLGELWQRTVAECIDAISWANNRRRLASRPRWIGELLNAGKASLQPGICAGCGCDDEHACRGGCAWVDPARTICSACDPSMSIFVSRVVTILHTKGLGARAEHVDHARAYIFASHPYGRGEASMTVEVISDGYARSETGSIVNPSDVALRIVNQLRKGAP